MAEEKRSTAAMIVFEKRGRSQIEFKFAVGSCQIVAQNTSVSGIQRVRIKSYTTCSARGERPAGKAQRQRQCGMKIQPLDDRWRNYRIATDLTAKQGQVFDRFFPT